MAQIIPYNADQTDRQPERQADRQTERVTSYLANSVGARARAYAREDMDALADAYCDALGRDRCPRSVMADMIAAMDAGMQPAVIIAALEATIDAPRPSWAYARAILRRCAAEGVYTPDQWAARAARHRGGGQRGNNRDAASQPRYTNDYFADFFADLGGKSGTHVP